MGIERSIGAELGMPAELSSMSVTVVKYTEY